MQSINRLKMSEGKVWCFPVVGVGKGNRTGRREKTFSDFPKIFELPDRAPFPSRDPCCLRNTSTAELHRVLGDMPRTCHFTYLGTLYHTTQYVFIHFIPTKCVQVQLGYNGKS